MTECCHREAARPMWQWAAITRTRSDTWYECLRATVARAPPHQFPGGATDLPESMGHTPSDRSIRYREAPAGDGMA